MFLEKVLCVTPQFRAPSSWPPAELHQTDHSVWRPTAHLEPIRKVQGQSIQVVGSKSFGFSDRVVSLELVWILQLKAKRTPIKSTFKVASC